MCGALTQKAAVCIGEPNEGALTQRAAVCQMRVHTPKVLPFALVLSINTALYRT